MPGFRFLPAHFLSVEHVERERPYANFRIRDFVYTKMPILEGVYGVVKTKKLAHDSG